MVKAVAHGRSAIARAAGRKKPPLPVDLKNVSAKFLKSVKRMDKSQLQDLSSRLGLPTDGKNSDHKDRILEHYSKTVTDMAEHQPAEAVVTGQDAEVKQTGGAESASHSVASESVKGKKKKWRVTDPAEIPPNLYHEDLFRANFPLVHMVKVPARSDFPVRDKFEGVVLDGEATRAVRKEWLSRLFVAADSYRVPENERQSAAVQFAFLEPLRMVTRPSKGDIQAQNEYLGKRKWRYDDIENVGRAKARKVAEEEDYEGMYIVPDREEQFAANGDYTGLEIGTEEEGDLVEDEVIPTGFADGVLHIFSDSAIGMMDGGDPDKVAAVLQRKFAEDKHKWDARFQGGFYAVKHSLENLRKGHGSAVYVIVMTSSTWSYGILVPEGYVHIQNGNVAPSSMEQFQRHQQMTGQRTMTYEDLQKRLRAGTKFYQRCYRDNPTAEYKDGPMLVGSLYLCSTWYNLPITVIGGGSEHGARRLFDGLLRILLGDSVMDLSKQDFEDRMKLRKEMLNEKLELCLQ